MSAGRRPRVLVAITLAEIGGAQTYVASLLPALVEHYDVTLAAHGDGPLVAAARAAGVEFAPLRQVRRPLSPWRDLLGLVELFRLMRRVKPDLVHLNSSKVGILGSLAAIAARVPIRVFTVNGWAFFTFGGAPLAPFFRRLGKVIRLCSTMVICVSEAERRAGIEARTCRADRSVVIHNAVDVGSFLVAEPHNQQARLVSVGRLRHPKDFVTFVDALGSLDHGRFLAQIVGDGPDRPEVEAAAARANLNGGLALLGERHDVPELLADADAFVLSSGSEGLPLSILEAMASGLPVVASAVGGIPELIVDGETGYLVPPGDSGSLATALEKLVADPELRVRMGRAARERAAAKFDVATMRQAHLDVYERLFAEYRSRR